jgi:hypothetical protein
MQFKLTKYFLASAGALLAGLTTALFLSNLATVELTEPHDPLIIIPLNSCFWLLGFLAIGVTAGCVFMRQTRFKLALILWFTINVITYRFGLQLKGLHEMEGYTYSLAVTFGLSNKVTNGLLICLFLYLFVGSAAMLAWTFIKQR